MLLKIQPVLKILKNFFETARPLVIDKIKEKVEEKNKLSFAPRVQETGKQ